ncbi:DUF3332 domain-containing protein [Vibrio rumoiensis]|uniref:DUF3332 domain-containing protein n=1 Tax=Vibrio rumoiensis 1S-45 TaxID=1188252 RepID=A0A1E5E469_9VIBR|nr:DUF3332 domain-containing protein [Vibrio rumoiensis]OEF27532.1 hypothetical protein A1QC_06305 [Vibrio rumoiensis 1S-45]
MKKLKVAIVAALGVTTLSGCMGQMGVTGLVTKGNLMAVDNRYAREGLFILLSPVYGIASIADLFIFNSIEFWTGKNMITGKSPAVVDKNIDALLKVNDKVDSSLKTAPIQANNAQVENTTIQQIDNNTLQMNISYVNGTQKTLRGVKTGDAVAFYADNQLVTTVKVQELENYVTAAQL